MSICSRVSNCFWCGHGGHTKASCTTTLRRGYAYQFCCSTQWSAFSWCSSTWVPPCWSMRGPSKWTWSKLYSSFWSVQRLFFWVSIKPLSGSGGCVNTVRRKAGKWRWRNSQKEMDCSTKTPSSIMKVQGKLIDFNSYMAKLLRLILLTIVLTFTQGYRLFLMGGAIQSNNSELYNALAKATRRTPSPNKCADDWSTTPCPRIAVVTSAAASAADGDNAYSVDEPNSPSYYTLFKMYGMAPLHVSAHIDNFKTATNISTAEGNKNLQTLLQADIVFFNGGDQSRHARTWLTDTGDCNAILCQLLERYRKE